MHLSSKKHPTTRSNHAPITQIWVIKDSLQATVSLSYQVIFYIYTIRASMFEGFESRRSSRSLTILILAVASSQFAKNLKMRGKIWGRKNWELLLFWWSSWLCFWRTCSENLVAFMNHIAMCIHHSINTQLLRYE